MMFGNYSEKARRVIFFSRYEVSQLGAQAIEPEHLLLGLLREGKAMLSRLLPPNTSLDMIRKRIEEHTGVGEKYPTYIEVPLSDRSKRVLGYAAEESDGPLRGRVGTAHLLLGILREEGSVAAEVLKGSGIEYGAVRGACVGKGID